MTFQEFSAKSFPESSVFARKQFDFVTNLVKWVAIRLAYLLFKMGMTANFLDVIGLGIALVAFVLLSTASPENRLLPLLGIPLIFFHLLVDFVDGAIAKAQGLSSKIGHHFDNLGCDLDRLVMIVLFGLYSQNTVLLIANLFAAGVLVMFLPLTRPELPDGGLPDLVHRIFCHKFSFLSVRLMLTLAPLILGLAIYSGWDLKNIGIGVSIFYHLAALVWLLVCIPYYPPRSRS